MGFHQRGQITAVDSLYPLEVRLAVVGHILGALLMDVQPTVWKQSWPGSLLNDNAERYCLSIRFLSTSKGHNFPISWQ